MLINKDFRACSGVKCYLQTALRKAPELFQLVKTHFRHHPKNATAGSWDCPWTTRKDQQKPFHVGKPENDPALPLTPPCQNGETFAFDCDIIGAESLPESTYNDVLPPPGLPEDRPFDLRPLHDEELPPPPPLDHEGPFHHEPPSEDGSFHFGPPPPPPHSDLPGVDGAPGHHPPPPLGPEHHPRPHHHVGSRPFHMPHPAPRHRHFRLILAVAGITISVLIFAVLFKGVRIYLSNPRVRADRAARIEECRTRREYRKAACQHRIRQCFSRFYRTGRGSQGISDYEEKRAILQRSDKDGDVESHIVGADINSLRRAHAIVGQLMRAEEGRMHAPSSPQGQTSSSSRSVRSLQTATTTLPPYAPPPPRYSMELSRDMEVVDGFRYTPSQSEATELASSASSFIINDDDFCTESSVVDCRSRMSLDTESAAPSVRGSCAAEGRGEKSLELVGDRHRGRFD